MLTCESSFVLSTRLLYLEQRARLGVINRCAIMFWWDDCVTDYCKTHKLHSRPKAEKLFSLYSANFNWKSKVHSENKTKYTCSLTKLSINNSKMKFLKRKIIFHLRVAVNVIVGIENNQNGEKYVFRLVTRVGQHFWVPIRNRTSVLRGESEFFSMSHARDETENILLYFFTELKTYHLTNWYWRLILKDLL